MALPVIAWFGFSSIGMLGWAAAALIPILIHFLKMRRKATVPWAAMQLLREIVERETRRVNLQQVLLLILRVSILLVLATALAQPFLNRETISNHESLNRPNKTWILIVDTSYSMGYQSGPQTRMQRARQLATAMVRESLPGDAFALIALDSPSRAIVSMPSFDNQSLLRELQDLNDNARGCDPASALSIASGIINKVRLDPQWPQDIEVVVLTDLGEDAWQMVSNGPLATALNRIQQLAKLTIKPIVEANSVNVAVESVQPPRKRLVEGRPFTVEVVVASYGKATVGLPVELVWNGQIQAVDRLDIEADGRKTIPMTVTPSRSGQGELSIVTPGDSLPIDDRFDMVLHVRSGLQVLIVQSNSDDRSAWQLALQPGDIPTNLGFQADVQVVSERQLANSREFDWDVIVLQDPILVEEGLVERLRLFTEAGGCLIVALGKNFTHSPLLADARFSESKRAIEELLGFRILEPSPPGNWQIDPLEYRSPIVKVFEGFPNSGLLTTPVFRYWQIAQEDRELNVDVALNTGHPLILHRRCGRGYVGSMTTAPEDGRTIGSEEGWNAITAWPSFLPLVHQMIQVLFDDRLEANNQLAGQPLTGLFRGTGAHQTIQVIRPDDSEIQVACQRADNGLEFAWTYEDTDQQGVYQVIEPENRLRKLAVNLDSVQSSLKSIDSKILRLSTRPVPTDQTRPGNDATDMAGLSQDKLPVTHHWTNVCLVGLFALLVAESLTGWALGRKIG